MEARQQSIRIPPVQLNSVEVPPQMLKQGELFVIAEGGQASSRCLKCNSTESLVALNVYLNWRPDPGFVGRLPIVRTVHRVTQTQSSRLTVFLCPIHHKAMTIRSHIFAVLAFLSFLSVLSMLVFDRDKSEMLKFIGGLLIFATLGFFTLYRVFARASLNIKHKEVGYLWIEGAGAPFLNSLPEVTS